jgi:serine phosphatase RsbU (regulator of sigma subunit)
VIDRIEDGELHRVAIAHADPVKERLGKEFERLHPSTLDGDGGVATVASTGESMLVPAITREMLDEGARNDEHRVLLHELGFHSAMVVPIRAGSEILGALSFATAESRRSLDETDLALAEELARRVASTMQNARLFAERALIADTLQRGLLPPDLPKIPGVVLSARFRPVGHGVVIGGDFYDVFELGEDTWGFVIGDVCGKGPAAAGLTALVRYTLRAVAGGPGDLTDTLRLVNSAIIRQHGDGQFCTAAYGVLRRDEDGFDLELAVAGHPQPLLVRDGECQGLGEPGLLLGVHPDPELNVTRIRMVDKDTLILYTDGLTEAHAPQRIIEDEELCRAAAAAAERSPTEIARALEERLVGEPTRSARDDIAILSITVV